MRDFLIYGVVKWFGIRTGSNAACIVTCCCKFIL